ncbi:MAG: S9 family peptidase [Bullifex sp.]|nr:S9 family peptidase [Spirochaetales bacterium]MDY5778220.1 S9 family peptidase [Bullifex sp.]
MNRLKTEDFVSYTYLSGVRLTEDGVFFIAAKADMEKNGYEKNIYTLNDNGVRKLTSGGLAGGYQVREGKVFFAAKRSDKEKNEAEKTFIYSLPLDGGEADCAYTLDGAVGKFDFASDGTIVALKGVDTRLDGLTGEERTKQAKELEGYEDISEMGFYLNGEGYTAGRRTRLCFYKDEVLKEVFSDGFNAYDFTLSPDRTKLVVSGQVRTGVREQLFAEVREVNISTGEWKTVLEDGHISVEAVYHLGDGIVAVGSPFDKYGLNQNPDFFRVESGKPVLLRKWGEAIGNSVGTDVRLGGGPAVQRDGGYLYFISTEEYMSNIFRIDTEGTVERVTSLDGSVDSFAVNNGRVVFAGLQGQYLQELYDEKGGILTHMNEEALKDKYVALPEEVTFENDGIPFKGWVLKPYGYEEGRKYPAILDIHGGPKTVYGKVFMHEMQLWASKGYFVFWTNPRGADGRGDEFADIRGKYGTIDFDDLMVFTDKVLELYPDIDRTRVGETGGSYGGFMSNWILGHSDRFAAIATQRSIVNWVAFWGTSDIGPYFVTDQCAAGIDEPEKLWERSPMKAIITNASTPTLIIHSDKDYRCPVSEGYQLFNLLADKGVETKLVLFHDENHDLSRSGKPKNRIKRLSEITKWFEKYLK